MGFVKLPDDLDDWAWFGDNNALSVYIRFRFEAKYKDTDVGNVHLKRGQLITTIPKIAEKNSITIQQARTAIERLKSTGKITVKSIPKFSIITLIDYDPENENNSQNNSQTTDKQQTGNSQITDKQQTNNSPSLLTTNSKQANSKQACARTREEPAEKPRAVERPKPEKRKFAEFVSLTNDEYSSLVAKLGEQGAKRCIEILDNYKGANGKKYASDYRAILNWVVTRYNEEQAKLNQQAQGKPSGTFNTGNPFTDLLRELDEQEAKEIDVPGYSTDYGNS